MKSLSASVIVLAGALMLVGGSFVGHDQTQAFLQLVGAVIGLAGLVVWYYTIKLLQD